MYNSPITLIAGDFSSQLSEAIDGQVMCKIKQEYGINVNKEELINALAYDRNQYDTGYVDGKEAAYKNVIGAFSMYIGIDNVEELEARIEEYYGGNSWG